MDFEHDLGSLFPIFTEIFLQDHDHKLHGGEIVIEHDHLVHRRRSQLVNLALQDDLVAIFFMRSLLGQ